MHPFPKVPGVVYELWLAFGALPKFALKAALAYVEERGLACKPFHAKKTPTATSATPIAMAPK